MKPNYGKLELQAELLYSADQLWGERDALVDRWQDGEPRDPMIDELAETANLVEHQARRVGHSAWGVDYVDALVDSGDASERMQMTETLRHGG